MLDKIQVLADGVDHSEGVAWGNDGFLYSGGEEGQIYRISLDGSFEEIARGKGEILGVAVSGSGNVYACDSSQGAVIRIDRTTGSISKYSSLPMILPNYLCFDEAGSLFVTDSGDYLENNGKLFRVEPDGSTEVWETTLGRYPNGCCLDASGRFLYVVESYLPGVSRIPIQEDGSAVSERMLPRCIGKVSDVVESYLRASRIPIQEDGSAGEAELVVETPDAVPDGIAFDAAGALYISCWRPDRIYRFEDGRLTVFADDPHAAMLNAPTNVAFIGEELAMMAIANAGDRFIGVVSVDTPGLPLRYPDGL